MASLTKRGESYKVMVSLGYDIHGKQIRKTTTFTPPPNVTEGKGRKLAEAFAHDFEKRCRGVSDLGENIRFKDMMEWYYTEVAPNVIREGTIYDQKVLLNLYVVEEFGHLKLKDITTARLDELWNRLKKDGGRREYYAFRDKDAIPLGSRRETARAAGLTENIVYRACNGEKITRASAEKIAAALEKPFKELFELVYEKGGLSSATVSHIRATMSAIMRTAVKKGLLEKNPVVNTTPPKPDNKKKLFLDAGQCKQLLDIFENIENRQLRVMINTLLFTGLRSGELLALQWRDGRLNILPRRWTAFGLPLPRALMPGGDAWEEEVEGTFRFHVEIKLPLAGPVVCYEGWLEPQNGAEGSPATRNAQIPSPWQGEG